MTTIDVLTALTSLSPGVSIIYFTGELARARMSHGPAATEAETVARCAWGMYEQGRVRLTQRRIGIKECEYIATGRAKIGVPRFKKSVARKAVEAKIQRSEREWVRDAQDKGIGQNGTPSANPTNTNCTQGGQPRATHPRTQGVAH